MSSNIWQLQSRGDVQGIMDALDQPDTLVRSRAIIALRQLKATESIPKLQQLRDADHNPEIRRLIDHALEVLAKEDHIEEDTTTRREHLLSQIKNPNTDAAELAIKALGKLGDQTVVEPLIMIFREGRQPARLRLAAAESLLALGAAPASASLLGALRKPDWQVRRNAAAILGHLKSDWATIPLVEAMKTDPNQYVRQTAMAALRRIGTDEAIEAVKNVERMIYDNLPSTE